MSAFNQKLTHLLAQALIAVGFLNPNAHAETWVITDRNHPIQAPSGARLILLDDSERLEAKLSEGLPADPQQAAAIMLQRLRSSDAQRLQQDLVAAQQNVVDAWTVGVTKIPAVVVDRKYVVYGETDVGSATQRIARWKGGMR
ncbi:TIGR03757 family integrating conjugative element protein [Pseudomonas syringae]|uniref:TIGR03757 family integrating conjugative element protein n=1 Tax=Pseudomonas syringae TaxID=317 RepID=UPI001F07C30B|nr:TIGR03757 family integrating conjugative element protein [Pseudomonas syringae]